MLYEILTCAIEGEEPQNYIQNEKHNIYHNNIWGGRGEMREKVSDKST